MAGRTVHLTYGTLIGVNAVNYLYFLVLANALNDEAFQHFTFAASVVALAIAAAEAGILYVAPPLLRSRAGKRAARVTGAFLAISACVLVLGLFGLSGLLSVLRPGVLDPSWVAVALAIAAPNITLQAWLLVRLRYGMGVLAFATALRGIGLFAVSEDQVQTELILATSALSISAVLLGGRVGRELSLPRWVDVKFCLMRLRTFAFLRTASVLVTAGVPFLIGMLQGPAVVAWYMIGDRTRTLFASLFQPLVHALYLAVCRTEQVSGIAKRLLSVPAIVALLAVSAIAGVILAGRINDVMYASKFPEPGTLGVFILTGHVTVLSSIAYLVKLIPSGMERHFIRAGLFSPFILLAVLMLVFADPVKGPAIAVLVTELFLCIYVWGAWWLAGGPRPGARGGEG